MPALADVAVPGDVYCVTLDPAPLLRAKIDRAVHATLALLRAGEGVVVHCLGGTGRTGTVLGCVLVQLGHDADEVVRYLDGLHRSRSRAGWPEAAWQADVVRSKRAD